MNWSSGYPPLFLGLLNYVLAASPTGTVTNEGVNRAAPEATKALHPLISHLWDDCPSSAKDIYYHLTKHGDLSLDEVGKEECECLIEKGFARRTGNKLAWSCRMLQQHVGGAGPETGSMARLFGNWGDYESNIRTLLEKRISQIPVFHDRLCKLVKLAIELIPQYPDDCLNGLTSIEELAFDLVWQREFGQARIIPAEIIEYWAKVGANDNGAQRLIQQITQQTAYAVPPDRGPQCGILQLLTGSRFGFESRAKYVTKDTYVLINAIHSFRNRNQHSVGESMHGGVAVSAIMLCIELLACLERELAS